MMLKVTTGGSTGEPLSLIYTKGIQRSREQAFIEKQWERIGYNSQDLIAVLRSAIVERLGSELNGHMIRQEIGIYSQLRYDKN